MNFSAVHNVPLIIIVENNHYAYSTPTNLQYKCAKLIDKAAGYGIEGHSVDGNNAPQLFALLNRLAEDIRKSPRTVMVECDTMRMRGHGEHDDARYVPRELLAEYEARDPIQQLRKYLDEHNIMPEAETEALKTDCIELVRSSYKQAVTESPPPPGSLMDGIYPHE